MNRRVFIVHGWDGHPEEGWFPWLKRELVERGFDVYIPQLPEASTPRIYNWVPARAEAYYLVSASDLITHFPRFATGDIV